LRRGGTFHEESQGGDPPQEAGRGRVGLRERKSSNGVDRLSGDAQWLSTGCDDAKLGASAEQSLRHLADASQHVFAVVEHKEKFDVAETLTQQVHG
jgi:hypothetical protein